MDTQRRQRRRQIQCVGLFWTMVIQAIVIYDGIRHRARHLPRAPHRNWVVERQMTLTRMFGTSDKICRDLLRMKIGLFQRLCARLRTFGLVDSKSVRVNEEVAIFINTVGHDQQVVINATINNSPYEKDNVKPWYSFFQLDLMAHLRHNTAAPFQVPIPTTATTMDDNDTNSTQVDPSTKIRQVRWNDDMDGFMIIALINQVLVGHKRSDNGFTSFQISKAIESVKHECGIVVTDKNVRELLKTLKREYAEVSQLLSISGFGWDAETGRITADSLAWDDLVKGKHDFGKWRTNLCRRYDDMECIFGNDTATEDRAVSGFDNFSPMQVDESVNELDTPTEDTDPSPTPSQKRHSEEGTNTGRRKRTKPHDDDSQRSLALIAESSKKIADALHMQTTLDTLNHMNWQLITEKLEAMDLDLVDIMKVMKVFRSNGDLAKVFMSLTNTTIMRALVFEHLGSDPPPLP
ncbi:Myb/SANT-like DNA-binding domain-containing protein [Forsythia ovata]|uniref:Myb/SANT-like DNA-binding domain-containing protein n=1 Tax=Forsythia ovata TaxID=205694 RepID=A0ABD1RPP8_9LAMI